MAKKKLKEYGYDALGLVGETTKKFSKGESDPAMMLGVARGGNTTARLMDSTLRVEKFNTALSLAKK